MSNNAVFIDNTRFIFKTNFSGDPKRDNFGSDRRKASVIIPDPELAKELIKSGFTVKETGPREDDDPNTFVPEFHTTVLLSYRDRNGEEVRYPPKVYLVSGDNEPRLLDEESVREIDEMRIENVDVVLNPYQHNVNEGRKTLYIRTMYVVQKLDDDPYAAKYRGRSEQYGEGDPF